MSRLRRRQSGFTLLELVLATTTAAMLALALYVSMNVAVNAQRSANATADPARETAIVADLIARDFESVPPPTGILSGTFIGTPGSGRSGANDTVTFFCFDSGTGSEPFDSIQRVELGLRTDVTPAALVRRVQRHLLAATEPEPIEEVLCQGVVSFALRYFDGTSWLDAWDSTQAGDILPQAVQLSLVLEHPDRRSPQAPRLTRVTRVVPLSCYAPAETEEATEATP